MKSSLSPKQLSKIIEHENEHWSKVFDDEKRKVNQNLYSSYWWEDYYSQITAIMHRNIKHGSSIAEIGSGSGKASLLLGNRYKKHLFDVSPPALEFAKYLTARLKAKHVKFSLGNGFDTKLKAKSYDLVWNIGVIEHYTCQQATSFITEMVRITKNDGYVAIAVPNFKSFQIWKARALNKPFFKHIPGYRLDSENDYRETDIQRLLGKACAANDRKIVSSQSFRVGNPLPMGSPKYVIRSIGVAANRLLPRNRFLLIVMVKLKSSS